MSALRDIDLQIGKLLKAYAPEKSFKGSQHVGALGEVYAKLMLGGTLRSEDVSFDLVTADGAFVSVKTRKGRGTGWSQSSAIPRIDDKQVTDLVFIHLDDDYSLRKAWRYPWQVLKDEGRFKVHQVAGLHRSYVFSVRESTDSKYEIFPAKPAEELLQAHDPDSPPASISIDELTSMMREAGMPLTEPERLHWSTNPMWTDALDMYHAARASGRRTITLDLDRLEREVLENGTLTFELMHAMSSVRDSEGEDGHRGAPRVLTALLQLLHEHAGSA